MVQLDSSQRAFVEAPIAQNIRLLAPAGCGKTLCLLHRCKYIAERSERPQRFLIVTFTRAARDELKARLTDDREFAGIRDLAEISTLNSWGYARIKSSTFSHDLVTSHYDRRKTIRGLLQPVWKNHQHIKGAIQHRNRRISQNAPLKLMNMIDALKSLGFDHTRHKTRSKFLSRWKKLERLGLGWQLQEQIDQLIKFEILEPPLDEDNPEPASRPDAFFDIFYNFWLKATQHLIDHVTFTLDDQKYFAYLDEREKIEKSGPLYGVTRRYHHVIVDEFQDINPLDLALIRAIYERDRSTLTIAGDDDQAIFEWRGSTPEYILEPAQYFNDEFTTYTLEVNYRSPRNIVEHSQRLIARNTRRVHKRISAHSMETASIEVERFPTLTDALEYAHDLVKSNTERGLSPGRIALIGRVKWQIIPFQVFFASKNIDIPFCAAEDLQIFLSEAFNNLLHLLTIHVEVDQRKRPRQVADEIIWLCDYVYRYPVARKDKLKLRIHLEQCRPRTITDGIVTLMEYQGTLKGKNEDGAISLAMADAIRQYIDANSVTKALQALSDTFRGLQHDFEKSEEDIFYKDPPFAQLAEYAKGYGSDFDMFIDDIESAKDTLVYIPPIEDEESRDDLSKSPLHLMTALRAKGKEFDKVILLDVEEGIWPNRNARSLSQLEAERRVFYVAFTRAREQVTMLLRSGEAPSPYITELGLVN